jgi:hypothetical protein
MAISDEEYELASKRAEEMQRTVPSAVGVQLERSSRLLVIALNRGPALNVPVSAFAQLAKAGDAQLTKVEISPSGFGIYFPELDVDLYVPALLEEFGSASQRSLAEQANRLF